MANRIRRQPATAPPKAGGWEWLKKQANQQALRFIGAGIVAAVGLLISLGIFHKPESTSTKAAPTSSASQPAPVPVPTQDAFASGGGSAINIQGNGNQVGTGKP